ncbi:protein of unknown function [Trichlorobacter ammonificans]|uniref:Uncharacterized protein n=1 Tax=Trichlorobacter ammonificans TaxID=2916410 RepID=A0ABN8HC02_9BACT|nr:protein of unknown function [Trichlorobacter ammonificans]
MAQLCGLEHTVTSACVPALIVYTTASRNGKENSQALFCVPFPKSVLLLYTFTLLFPRRKT